MIEPIPVYTGSVGLNTRVDPTRLPFDPDTGVTALSMAVNVRHDDTGRVSRRKGYSLSQAGAFHSLWSNGDVCFVVMNGALYSVGTDLSLQGIRSGIDPTARMAFCDAMGLIYYGNGINKGVIDNGISKEWTKGIYVGATTSRVFAGPVNPQHIAFFSGRMFLSYANVLWWSEPFAPRLYDMARSYIPFGSKVKMMFPVKNGIFVSDSKLTYFLTGTNPKEFYLDKVANYPALEWSENHTHVDGNTLGIEGVTGLCAAWASERGVCVGTPDGRMINITEKDIVFPPASTGSIVAMGDNIINSIS